MIPIFIIVKDRLTVLKRSIESYKKLGNVEIILIDNGSTYIPLLEFFNEFKKEGKIYYNKQTNDFREISENIRKVIDDWFSNNVADYYIVTDPDIELENPSPDLLNYYISVIEKYNVDVVGPMLRINDIPDCFELKKYIQESHTEQFYKYVPTIFNNIKIQSAFIDTTFGLYKKSFKFHRLNLGIRVHEPYNARHLDWYINTKELTDEQKYYINNASVVSTLSQDIKKLEPFFSIIVSDCDSVINEEKRQRFLDSMKNQTFQNFEIILMHDGERTKPFISNIYDLKIKHNNSLFRANVSGDNLRSYGMQISNGKYLINTNIDNIYYHDALENIHNFLTNNDCEVIICPIKMMGMNRNGTSLWYDSPRDYSKFIILSGIPPVVCNIDIMNLIASKNAWKNINYWHIISSTSDGELYTELCSKNTYKYLDFIIGEHY